MGYGGARIRRQPHGTVDASRRCAKCRTIARTPGATALGDLVDERKMADQHGWDVRVAGREAKFGLLHACMTPRLSARVWVRVQHQLIAAHHPRRLGQRERLSLRAGDVTAKCVVVEEKQRCDRHWASGTLPNRIGVLWCNNPDRRHISTRCQISLLAAQIDRVVRDGPQLMVAGYPHDFREPLTQQAQRPFDINCRLTYISAHQQPVGGRARPKIFHYSAIVGVSDVQVTYAEQSSLWRRIGGHQIYHIADSKRQIGDYARVRVPAACDFLFWRRPQHWCTILTQPIVLRCANRHDKPTRSPSARPSRRDQRCGAGARPHPVGRGCASAHEGGVDQCNSAAGAR